jgi:hypothetical protein
MAVRAAVAQARFVPWPADSNFPPDLELPSVTVGLPVIIGRMSFADWLAGRKSHADRLPDRIEDLRGPSSGVIVLPRHLAFPGNRECDVTDDDSRRNMYGVVLTQGQRNDVARYLNPHFLRLDWPHIAGVLDPRLRGACERRFALGARARSQA